MSIYLRLILSVIHLFQSLKAFSVSKVEKYGDLSDPYGEVNVRARISNELLYIVAVVTDLSLDNMNAYNNKVCTGTMIRNDMVMTLASCLLKGHAEEPPDPEDVKVYERNNLKALKALKVILNFNYFSKEQSVSKANDFVLIRTERSKQVLFPQLPQDLNDFKDIQNTCLIAGYGYPNGSFLSNFKAFYLNRTKVKVLKGSACNQDRLCLNLMKIMPCTEDQGGPIICDGILYAVYSPKFNSFSAQCLDIDITPFSLVYNIKGWVEHALDGPALNLQWLSNPFYVLLLCIVLFTVMGTIYYVLVEFLQKRLDPTEVHTQAMREDSMDSDSSFDSGGILRHKIFHF